MAAARRDREGPESLDFDEDQLEAELDWEADCIGRMSRLDPASACNVLEERSKRLAAKIGRPPARRTGATPTPTPAPPPPPAPAPELAAELDLDNDPAVKAGAQSFDEHVAKTRRTRS